MYRYCLLDNIDNFIGKGFGDNPKYIYMRNNKPYKIDEEEFEICGKRIIKADLKLEDDDYLLLMSDGVVYAGSQATYNLSFNKDVIVDYLKNNDYRNFYSFCNICIIINIYFISITK